ncbi:hypothetical protein AWB79_01109 [Caballeronia hypogeia]|uniref:Uncharacterized protein n=1 Tax=Caballeronia hypogeia TaxID=1777140 RepID=A0A157ZN07_9BURK|nr:hypothetical protein [Caballeronia hypogeia]SAK46347.1 hypothetical protein AWB79_01109 [Caballeronia hypogeia]
MTETPDSSDAGDPDETRSIAVDLARCDKLIAHAVRTGVPLRDADIAAVSAARRAHEAGAVHARTRRALHAAMNRIACDARYPNPRIAADVDRCGDLVSYAAHAGKTLPESDIACLSVARAAQFELAWNAMTEALFYGGMGRIARAVSPITAETAGEEARIGARKAIKVYARASYLLAFVVVSLSCLLFMVDQISGDVTKVVAQNDAAALNMHNLLQAYRQDILEAKDKGEGAVAQLQNSQPALEIKQLLQQFATNNRQLYADVKRTEKIRWLLFMGGKESPYKPRCATSGRHAGKRGELRADLAMPLLPIDATQETDSMADDRPATVDWACDADTRRHALEVDLPLLETGPKTETIGGRKVQVWRPEEAVDQGFQKMAVYQDIRAMAVNDRDVMLGFVGAVTSFLLPVLYAWLGACAAILRQLNADTSASLFDPEHSKVANRAHITAAVIVGISIGLFSKVLHEGVEFSPLAVAFVAGYASDKFFAFIDRLVTTVFPARPHLRAETAPPVTTKKTHSRVEAARAAQ